MEKNTVMQRVYMNGFRSLIAWKEAKLLTIKIYQLTKNFPKEETYHLTNQLRRASASIMANIAEGSAMPTKAHRYSYFSRARGSVVEVDSFSELCHAMGLMDTNTHDNVTDHCARLSFLITKLMG